MLQLRFGQSDFLHKKFPLLLHKATCFSDSSLEWVEYEYICNTHAVQGTVECFSFSLSKHWTPTCTRRGLTYSMWTPTCTRRGLNLQHVNAHVQNKRSVIHCYIIYRLLYVNTRDFKTQNWYSTNFPKCCTWRSLARLGTFLLCSAIAASTTTSGNAVDNAVVAINNAANEGDGPDRIDSNHKEHAPRIPQIARYGHRWNL